MDNVIVTSGAIATTVTAIVVLIGTIRNGRKIQSVRISVDGHMTDLYNRVTQLTNALEGSDTDVPNAPEVHPAEGG